MLKTYKLKSILLGLKAIGLSPEKILQGSGVSWSAVRDLTRLDHQTTGLLFELIVARTHDGAAAECARHLQLRHWGLAGYGMLNCETVRESLQFWVRYAQLTDHPVASAMHVNENSAQFRQSPRVVLSPAAFRFCVEYAVAGIVASYTELSGRSAVDLCVRMPFSQPKQQSCYDGWNVGDVAFGASSVATVTLNREAIEAPVVSREPEVLAFLHKKCDHYLTLERSLSMRQSVLARLETCERPPTLAHMANMLEVTVPVLRESLAVEGDTYSAVVESYRRERAEQLFREGVWDFKEISWHLGFSNPSSLRRALDRWQRQRSVMPGGTQVKFSVPAATRDRHREYA